MSDDWMKKIKEFAFNIGNKKRIRKRSGKLANDHLNLMENEFSSDVIRAKGKIKGFNKKRQYYDNHFNYNNASEFDD